MPSEADHLAMAQVKVSPLSSSATNSAVSSTNLKNHQTKV